MLKTVTPNCLSNAAPFEHNTRVVWMDSVFVEMFREKLRA